MVIGVFGLSATANSQETFETVIPDFGVTGEKSDYGLRCHTRGTPPTEEYLFGGERPLVAAGSHLLLVSTSGRAARLAILAQRLGRVFAASTTS